MIVIDIETTGTNPQKHALVSLGAIELENPENEFYAECRAWEGARLDERAMEINGFQEEDITDPSKQTPEILLRGFSKWADQINERTLAGHNVSFDTGFLRASYEREGLEYPFAHRTIDTHSLVYMHMVKQGLVPPVDKRRKRTDIDSDLIFSYVGLDVERGFHNALEDAKLTAEAISRLLYNELLLIEYKKYSIPWLS